MIGKLGFSIHGGGGAKVWTSERGGFLFFTRVLESWIFASMFLINWIEHDICRFYEL